MSGEGKKKQKTKAKGEAKAPWKKYDFNFFDPPHYGQAPHPICSPFGNALGNTENMFPFGILHVTLIHHSIPSHPLIKQDSVVEHAWLQDDDEKERALRIDDYWFRLHPWMSEWMNEEFCTKAWNCGGKYFIHKNEMRRLAWSEKSSS